MSCRKKLSGEHRATKKNKPHMASGKVGPVWESIFFFSLRLSSDLELPCCRYMSTYCLCRVICCLLYRLHHDGQRHTTHFFVVVGDHFHVHRCTQPQLSSLCCLKDQMPQCICCLCTLFCVRFCVRLRYIPDRSLHPELVHLDGSAAIFFLEWQLAVTGMQIWCQL